MGEFCKQVKNAKSHLILHFAIWTEQGENRIPLLRKGLTDVGCVDGALGAFSIQCPSLKPYR